MANTLTETMLSHRQWQKVLHDTNLQHLVCRTEMQIRDELHRLEHELLDQIPYHHRRQCYRLCKSLGLPISEDLKNYRHPAIMGIIRLHQRAWGDIKLLINNLKKLWEK